MNRRAVENKRQYCSGCRENFYNGNNPYGIPGCWCFGSAKIVTRYSIGWNTPMNIKSAYLKVKTLDCHRETGRYALLEKIPDSAK